MSSRRSSRGGRLRRIARRVVTLILIVGVVLPAGVTLAYRFLPVPATPLMVIRLFDGHGWSRDWVPFEAIAPALPVAILASEDNRFCQHPGFDARAIGVAIDEWQAGGGLRGASTISQQLAENLFLWPRSDLARKGLETYLTLFVEMVLPKQRIMELYLNTVEFGPGIYGAEAAARHHFGVSAADLSDYQAALLAAVLPNPLGRDAGQPGPGTQNLAGIILGRMANVRPALTCLDLGR